MCFVIFCNTDNLQPCCSDLQSKLFTTGISFFILYYVGNLFPVVYFSRVMYIMVASIVNHVDHVL